jgi:hypothetical protein
MATRTIASTKRTTRTYELSLIISSITLPNFWQPVTGEIDRRKSVFIIPHTTQINGAVVIGHRTVDSMQSRTRRLTGL